MERRGDDLEDQLLEFAARVGKVVDALPESSTALQYRRQLNRHRESQSTKGEAIANYFDILQFAVLILTFSMVPLRRVSCDSNLSCGL